MPKLLTDETKNAEGDKGEESLYQRHCELLEEYFQHYGDLRHLKPLFGRRDQLRQDRYYYEYHQYLCKVAILILNARLFL